MSPFPTDELLAHASERHHVLSLAEILGFGFSYETVRYAADGGPLRRLFNGVFAFTHRLGAEGRWRAAVLACGGATALHGRSAGTHRGILGTDGGVTHVGGPGDHRHRAFRHRRTSLEAWEVEVVDHIPTTIAARTLVDLCAGASPARVERLVARTERLRIYDHHQVLRVLDAHPRIPGAARLRHGLVDGAEAAPTKNVLEEAMRAICERIGRPRPLVNTLVEGVEVDCFWPHARLIVETDGRETHLTPVAFEADRARDAELTARGYRVVRFTYRQVMEHPEEVARTLARLLPG